MTLKETIYGLSRLFPAFMLMLYGGSKILGTQFGISEWIADLPVSELSGFHLTWYYFNYSLMYGYILAAVQIGGALLIIFRRTALLGTVILLPVMSNIVFINFFYGITDGALFMSLLITGSLLITFLFHYQELKQFFWIDQNKTVNMSKSFKGKLVYKTIVKTATIIVPLGILISIFLQETPKSPFEGVWEIEQWSTEYNDLDDVPIRIYFETITTHNAVFRYQDFRRQYMLNFETDDFSLSLYLPRIDGPEDYFDGNYEFVGEKLQLSGTLVQTDNQADIILNKVR